MKRHYVKVLSVASVVAGLCAANAFADTMGVTPPGPVTKGPVDVQYDYNEDSGRFINSDKNPAMNPYFNLVSEVNKVDIDFMLTIVGRYSLYDQTRTQNFDFLNQLALFGVHMFKNGWSADFIVRFAGNDLRSANFDPLGAVNGTPLDQLGQVGIRKASIAYRFWHNDKQLLKFTLGRFAPYGATAYDDDNIVRAWGTDATVNLWGPNGSGDLHGTYVDGALLGYQAKWDHSRINLGVGVASDFPIFLYMLDNNGLFNIHQNPYQMYGNDGVFMGNRPTGGPSTNASRAWLADAAYVFKGSWGSIAAAIDVGGKTRSEMNNNSFGLPGGSANAVNTWYIASSIGYNKDDKLGVGVWYNWTKTKTPKAGDIQEPDNAVITYTNSGNPSDPSNYTVFGVGINGNSKLWKWDNVLGKGGVMTWGAGYERFMNREGINTAGATVFTGAGNDVNLFSAAIGYSRGAVSTELDWAIFVAKNEVFYRQNTHAANSANVLYLTATFDI